MWLRRQGIRAFRNNQLRDLAMIRSRSTQGDKMIPRKERMIPRRTRIKRSKPPRKRRPTPRRGEPTKAEKSVERERVYVRCGGTCELRGEDGQPLHPDHMDPLLPA